MEVAPPPWTDVGKKRFRAVATADDEEDPHREPASPSAPAPAGRPRAAAMAAAAALLVALASASTLYATRTLARRSVGAAGDERWPRRWIPTLLADMEARPGYDGELVPRGRVTVRFEDDEGELLLRYKLEGLEPNCRGCGIHIHEGESCEDAGEHYFNHSLYELDSNPWAEAVYNSDENGDASNAVVVATGGIGSASTKGHAVVVHARDGTSIGCGVLANAFNINSMEAEVGPYPGRDYDGAAAPSGTARIVAFEDGVLRLRGTLEGLEPDCVRCGLHIHAGLATCDDAERVGGHWYEEEGMAGDPWVAQKATYTSDAGGRARFAFYVYNGYEYEGNIDHVLVVHGRDGAPIGCGVIKPREV